MYKIILRKILLIVLFASVYTFPFGIDKVEIKKVYLSFNKVYAGSELKIALIGFVENGWHINSNKPYDDFLIPTRIEIGNKYGIELVGEAYPESKDYIFAFSDSPVAVYEDTFKVAGLLKMPATLQPGEYEIQINFIYQACDDNTCLPPRTITETILITVVDNQSQIIEINNEIFEDVELTYSTYTISDDDSGFNLEDTGLFLALIIVFLGGLALNLTPCVYPLIPITIGYFGSQSEGNTGRLFLLGTLFVIGMAITYSTIGVVTALSGAMLGSLLQNSLVVVFIALVLLLLSLSMFGVYEFKLPDSLVAKAGGAKSGLYGSFFMGLTLGIVAAPCIGPFVLGLVTYVAAQADVLLGFLLFFVLALGLGLPYLFLAVFSAKIKKLPRSGEWMEGVKHIFGFLLIGMAIYFLEPLFPKEYGIYLLPIFMIFASLYLILFDKMGRNVKVFNGIKIVFSLLMIAAAVYFLYPQEKKSPDWQVFTEESFSNNLENGELIMIDVYADWCIPCKELDMFTFSDSRVIEDSKRFINYKVDLTRTMSEESRRFREQFNIIGVPTVLLFDSNGNEVERITGFLDANQFLERMKRVN